MIGGTGWALVTTNDAKKYYYHTVTQVFIVHSHSIVVFIKTSYCLDWITAKLKFLLFDFRLQAGKCLLKL